MYLLYSDGTESLALEQREITNHMGIFGIERNQWKLTQDYEFEKMNMQSGAMLFWPVLEG